MQQTANESHVDDPLLQAIQLDDCRHSLFERLLRIERKAGRQQFVGILRKQGRMHREVADFANLAYYGGTLDVVPLHHQLAPCALQHDPADALAHHLATHRMVFMAVSPSGMPTGTAAFHVGEDKVNRPEAMTIGRIAKTIHELYMKNGKEFLPDSSLGIIVPYRHQIACVRECLKEYGIPALLDVTIDTVERYQGSQRDVIVYGFTIQKRRQLEFLQGNIYDDNGVAVDRKLNVALTRAREQTILVGNPYLLSFAPDFNRLIQFVRERGGYLED